MKKLLITLAVLTPLTVQANNSLNTFWDVDITRNIPGLGYQFEAYNYQTNTYIDGDLQPDYLGGYTGQAFDFQRNQFINIEADQYGNVEIWEF